jgi:hypothetical protein
LEHEYEILNYTGHLLKLAHQTGNEIFEVTFPAVGRARISSRQRELEVIRDKTGLLIPLLEIEERNAVDLPERKDRTIYIVSSVVSNFTEGRDDIVSPSRTERDNNGRAIRSWALSKAKRGI